MTYFGRYYSVDSNSTSGMIQGAGQLQEFRGEGLPVTKRKKDMKKPAESMRGRLLGNPWIGGIGLVLASISILIAIYFGWKSTTKRELVLTQEESSVLVFDPGVTESFELIPKNLLWSNPDIDPLSQPVYSISFAIWNRGRAAIKTEHIIRALRIQIGNDAKRLIAIWDILPIAWSREEIEMKIGRNLTEEKGLPQIPISFGILELEDGASFQIIYSGPEDIDIILKGTVEGIPRNTFFPKRVMNWGLLSIAIVLWSNALFVYLTLIWRRKKKSTGDIAMVLFLLLMSGILLVWQRSEIKVLTEMPKFDYEPSVTSPMEN